MYEYKPDTKKKKEFWIVAILALSAGALFGCSRLPFCPYPALWQLVCVLLLVAVIMLISKCLLRSFLYRVVPREDADEETPPDFTVVECYGKRREVVCRISVTDIIAIIPMTRENRQQLSEMTRGKPVYRYFSELAPANAFQLTVKSRDEVFYLRIVADEGLISLLQKR